LARAVTIAVSRWPSGEGRAPIWPAETSVFWASSAVRMSPGTSA
jgi:hypothetical protein